MYPPTDVVVIGARRYTRLARVLGTTAARIVNCIDRPVFVVRYPIDSEIASSVAGSALRSAGALLRTDHERLERIYAGLLAAYESGDWTEVRAQWDIFEPTLVAHIDAEEKHIFPGFRAIDPAEAEALMSEHGELRKALGAFGVRVDLHALGAADVEQLVMRLRAHASREERLLYPWTDANVEVSAIEQALATASMRPAQALRTSA